MIAVRLPYLALLAVVLAVLASLSTTDSTSAGGGITLTVTSTGDEPDANPGDGICATSAATCTLRAAIQENNALANPSTSIASPVQDIEQIRYDLSNDDINYNPSGNYWRIRPANTFTAITHPVTIDATTQPGYDGQPVIWLDGSDLPPGFFGLHFFNVDDSAVRGLAITDFVDNPATNSLEGSGILFQNGANNLADDNWLGVNPEGNPGANTVGFWVFNQDAPLLKDNVAGFNEFNGMRIQQSRDFAAYGNQIGALPDGSPAGNFNFGVEIIDSYGDFGDLSEAPNVIGYNGDASGEGGVLINGSEYVGGTLNIVNDDIGVDQNFDLIPNRNGLIFDDGVQANDQIIITSVTTAGNLFDGLQYRGADLPQNGFNINNLFAGTDPSGDLDLGNGGTGVSMLIPQVAGAGGFTFEDSHLGYNGGTNIVITTFTPASVTPGSVLDLNLNLLNIDSFESGEDGLALIVHLPEGSTWSDGTAITLEDFEAVDNAVNGARIEIVAPSGTSEVPTIRWFGGGATGNGDNGVLLRLVEEANAADSMVQIEAPIEISDAGFSDNAGHGLYQDMNLRWALALALNEDALVFSVHDNTFDDNGRAAILAEMQKVLFEEVPYVFYGHNAIHGNGHASGHGAIQIAFDNDVLPLYWFQGGGFATVDENEISGNANAGVAVTGGNPSSSLPLGDVSLSLPPVTLSGNNIAKNGGLGIDLNNDGVTPNDAGDVDEGPNGLLNAPVLDSAVAGSVTITGTYDGLPNTTVTVEFFSDIECDPSGNGEGGPFIGSSDVVTDGAGHAEIDVTFDTKPPGKFVSATATVAGIGTSEFSNCLEGDGLGGILGDVDCDGDVDAVDALDVLKSVGGLGDPDCLAQGDVDCDGDVDAADALGILRHVAALPVNQHQPCPPVAT